MKQSGVELLYDRASRANFGIFEVLRDVPELAKLRAILLNEIKQRSPDLVLLVDFSGFNLNLASLIHKQNSEQRIFYFIAPQVWASRPWRIKTLARCVSKILVIFPFEEQLYKLHGIESCFVGHPLTRSIREHEACSRQEFCKKYNLNQEQPIIGVFPGSRRGEIKAHLEPILNAVDWLRQERAELQFVIPAANDRMLEEINAELKRLKFDFLLNDNLRIIPGYDNYELMLHSKLLWAKSGTTTLEATLACKPMIIFYRGLWLSYVILLCFLRVRYVGWPNLLSGRQLVPELLQLNCRAELLVRHTLDLLDVPGLLKETTEELKSLRNHLGQGDFINNVVQEIVPVFETHHMAS